MTGYDKIKKFVSEVHEINCALTDEIIEFIDEVVLQEQAGNVAKPDACSQLCAVCAYWLEDSEYKGLGACGNDTVHNQLIFGHVDMFLISGDFGCKYFKRK